MRQKYVVQRNDRQRELTIREFANLEREYKYNDLVAADKEFFSLLCEETYEQDQLRAAIKTGREGLISFLRTRNLYPIGRYVEKIADSIMVLLESDRHHSFELLFDDKELIESRSEPPDADGIEIGRLIELKTEEISSRKSPSS